MLNFIKTFPYNLLSLCFWDVLTILKNIFVIEHSGGNLKVRNADKYGWEPRRLLEQLVDIYLHLDSKKFYGTLANDERSFSLKLFETAASTLDKKAIKCSSEIVRFRNIGEQANNILQRKLKQEEDFSDAPDHFMGMFIHDNH